MPEAAVDRRCLDVGEVRLAYDVKGSGPPLILVHGLAGSMRVWDDVFDDLAVRFTVARFDMRGHGVTGGPPHRNVYRLGRLSGDLTALSDELHFERPAVIGHSLGGSATMWAALRHPDRFGRLVLVDCRPYGVPRRRAKWMLAQLLRVRRLGLVGAYDADEGRRLRDPAMGARYEEPAFAAVRRAEVEAVVPGAYWGLMTQALFVKSFAARLPELQNRALLVCGGRDGGMLPDMERAAELIPDGHLEVLPGSGHNPMMDAPAAFLEPVLSFLEGDARAGCPVPRTGRIDCPGAP